MYLLHRQFLAVLVLHVPQAGGVTRKLLLERLKVVVPIVEVLVMATAPIDGLLLSSRYRKMMATFKATFRAKFRAAS